MNRAVLAGLLALGCSEPTPPSRAGTYPFDFAGDVFHWPAGRPRVRFYAEPAGNLRFLVQRAVDAWAGLFLYGEFSGALVADSAIADVIVRWRNGAPPDVAPDTSHVYACTGSTSFPAVDPDGRYTGPIEIELWVLSGTGAQVAACMRRTAIHELGHALGLLQHSPAPGDIMWGPTGSQPLGVDLPTEQDRRTVEVLYHTRATILPRPP